jgi:hypothetical protein
MKMIGDQPLTPTERQARWRAKRDAKLARRAARRGDHTAPTMESFASLFLTDEDLKAMWACDDTPTDET